jgi:hypothetical protein
MKHPRSRPLLLTATVVTALAARGFWGCASEAPPGPGIESEGGTITPVDAGRDTSKAVVEAAPPEPQPPEGWVPPSHFFFLILRQAAFALPESRGTAPTRAAGARARASAERTGCTPAPHLESLSLPRSRSANIPSAT